MTKVDILNGLRKYNLGNRSMGKNGNCLYTNEQGNHCGVGQYLKPEFQRIGFIYNESSTISLKNESDNDTLDEFLVPEVHGHSEGFWEDVQQFHDWGENFTQTGLSQEGEETLKRLISQYTDS